MIKSLRKHIKSYWKLGHMTFNMQIIILNVFVACILCLDIYTFYFYKDKTSMWNRLGLFFISPVGLMLCSFSFKMSQVISFLLWDFVSQANIYDCLEVLTFGLHFLFLELISKEWSLQAECLPKEIKQYIKLAKMANSQQEL